MAFKRKWNKKACECNAISKQRRKTKQPSLFPPWRLFWKVGPVVRAWARCAQLVLPSEGVVCSVWGSARCRWFSSVETRRTPESVNDPVGLNPPYDETMRPRWLFFIHTGFQVTTDVLVTDVAADLMSDTCVEHKFPSRSVTQSVFVVSTLICVCYLKSGLFKHTSCKHVNNKLDVGLSPEGLLTSWSYYLVSHFK